MPGCARAGPSSDFHFVERDDPEKIAATLIKLVQERIPQRFRLDPIRDVQVLCPMNRGSDSHTCSKTMRLFAYCDNRKAIAGFSLVFPKQLFLRMVTCNSGGSWIHCTGV